MASQATTCPRHASSAYVTAVPSAAVVGLATPTITTATSTMAVATPGATTPRTATPTAVVHPIAAVAARRLSPAELLQLLLLGWPLNGVVASSWAVLRAGTKSRVGAALS